MGQVVCYFELFRHRFIWFEGFGMEVASALQTTNYS
jgi:hypothetical protein